MAIGAIIAAIGDAIAGAASSAATFATATLPADIAGALGPAGLGIGASTAGVLGDVGAGALEGGLFGAVTDPSKPLQGAEFGAITGGALGAAPFVGAELGIDPLAADALTGAAGGALGSAATGRNLLTGTLEGVGSGLLTSALSPGTTTSGTAPTAGGGATPAGTAVPASVAAAAPGGDVTLQTDTGGLSGTSTPGSVGAGASSGVASNVSGVNTPSSVGALATDAGPTTSTSLGTGYGNGGVLTGQAGVPTQPGASTGLGSLGTAPGGTPGLGQQIGSFLKSPQGLLAAGGLGLNLLQGNQLPKEAKALEAQEATDLQQGNQLESYLRSGTLPYGLQAGVTAANLANQASIRSQFANTLGGGSSSAEFQDIAAANQTAQTQGAQLAMQLYQQGVSQSQLGSDLASQLLQIQMQQDQQLSQSIGNFATAFANFGRPVQYLTPQTATLTG